MRKRQAWRYYCDFCKKAGCSGGHMARHERGCVKNPGRVCGMCRIATGDDDAQKPLAELIAALESGGVDGLRDLAGGCPSCMLAAIVALRLRDRERNGVLVKGDSMSDDFIAYPTEYPGHDFDYKAAVASMWSAHHEAQREQW